ncbi:hypothetical protein [Oleiagrimonas soli]|uniref:Uncharacterized protein n=1 Tax=Oleiagrimonas soli TaxID=1543381 RepID=A0A099CV06_9GAMM|nr:hypothetical protein [Oleiagrimonas soli]KGI77447.1 hypothetical protein LF63_0108810 [Oleiagrimonas soli]MBB6183107.1 hypothetical protein [Oleiagrimonas soli]
MSTPTSPNSDPMLDREERELASLYRQLPAVEPDAALDARILDAARRAVAPKPKRRPYRGLFVGFGSAASLVMAAGLTWYMHSNGQDTVTRTQAPAGLQAGAIKPAAPTATGAADSNRQVIAVRILPSEHRAPAAAPPAPAAAAPQAKAYMNQALAGRESDAADHSPTPSTITAADTAAERLVIPVRVLPADAASRQAASVALPAPALPAASNAARPAQPDTRYDKASSERATPSPTAKQLIDEARQALARNDKNRVRQLLRDFTQRFPGASLPSDLAPYAPSVSHGAGTP